MCGNIIKELVACTRNCTGAIGLSRGNGAESRQQGGIDSPGVYSRVPMMSWTLLILSLESGAKISVSIL